MPAGRALAKSFGELLVKHDRERLADPRPMHQSGLRRWRLTPSRGPRSPPAMIAKMSGAPHRNTPGPARGRMCETALTRRCYAVEMRQPTELFDCPDGRNGALEQAVLRDLPRQAEEEDLNTEPGYRPAPPVRPLRVV